MLVLFSPPLTANTSSLSRVLGAHSFEACDRSLCLETSTELIPCDLCEVAEAIQTLLLRLQGMSELKFDYIFNLF